MYNQFQIWLRWMAFLRQGTYQIKLLQQLSLIFHINKLGNLCGRAHHFLAMCSSFNSANVIMTTADLANCTSRWSDPTWKNTNKPGLFSAGIKRYKIRCRSEKVHEQLWGEARWGYKMNRKKHELLKDDAKSLCVCTSVVIKCVCLFPCRVNE